MTIRPIPYPTRRRLRPSLARPVLLSLFLLAALMAAGCGPDPRQAFQGSLAKETLACMHPRGVFQGASDFKDEGNGFYGGTIHWRGAALENEHTTRVRFEIEEDIAKVYLVEDSAFLPAARQSCEIPIVTSD
jgi:hypothetical protein